LRQDTLSEAVKTEVSGGIVFYGTDLAVARDLKFNPVYGGGQDREIPGVYHHAMALDNLLTLDGKVIHSGPLSDVVHGIVLTIVFCLVAWLVRTVLAIPGDGVEVVDLAVWSLCAVVVAWVEFEVLKISPGNWLGALLAINTGNLLRKPLREAMIRVVCRG
jgi:CHASE2 domain-containing sensor protein